MKRASGQIAIVPEKSAHYQVDANTGEDNHCQKLGKYRAYDPVKQFNPHVWVGNNNFLSILSSYEKPKK